jgi:hypothetical protein
MMTNVDQADALPVDPTLSSLFDLELCDENGLVSLVARLDESRVHEAAEVIARGVARRRIGVNARLYAVWSVRSAGDGPDPDARDLQLLVAGLLQNIGTPTEPASLNHLHGLVAEELWMELVSEVAIGLGVPVLVEGHDYSVTDPGGDGLTIYQLDHGFAFRLWESKYHGTPTQVRETVNEACRQVRDRSLSYLSRFSKIAQTVEEDAALAGFFAILPELWVNDDPSAGVGIAIGASSDAPSDDCFAGMPNFFGFAPARQQGHLSSVPGFQELAMRVRACIWEGCGWTVP